jgi:hypothetical protein
MRDFFNDVVGVMDKYEVTKTDHELCMLMAQKNNDASYARLILDELKSDSPNFDRLCNDISEIQRLMRSESTGYSNNKEVHLSSVGGKGLFKGKCRNCGKVCRFKAYQYKKQRGEMHGGCMNGDDEGNTNNGSSNKTCNFCGLKGHKESGCFKKFPEKAPAWFKEKSAKTKSASLNVEVSLMSLDPAKLGIGATSLQSRCNDTLAMLSHKKTYGFVTQVQVRM